MKNAHPKTIKMNKSNLYKTTTPFLLFIGLLFNVTNSKLYSQAPTKEVEYTKPSWWFGAALGANFNFYQGSTQQINDNLTAPYAFTKGYGIGLFGAPLIEFHRPESRWGVMLQAGYDSRKGNFDEIISPCNCPRDLSSTLSYITIEPNLRFAPFKSDFYLFGGPRVAFILDKSFVYTQKNDPANSDQTPIDDISGEFSQVKNTIYSMQIGAGYDIHITSQDRRNQFVISPFVAFLPYLGQDPRTIETWNITTIRAGAALKFGRGGNLKSSQADEIKKLNKVALLTPTVNFKVTSPKNITKELRVREIFPMSNYVFFDLGSTEIPDRYILIKKSEVKDFKEDQLEVHIPKRLSGRSNRQLIVYYNLLNILGDRMGNNPTAKIKLIGSSEQGSTDGLLMAKSVRNYLHDVFGIDTSRMAVEGNTEPKLPSMQPYVSKDFNLHKEGDRRVSIESNSPEMLMEFKSGPDSPLKPIEMTTIQVAPSDSYLTFNNEGSKEAFSSWSMEIQDEKGETQIYGPYNKEIITIPGKTIMGSKPEGTYKVTMIGQTNMGRTVRQDTTVSMVLWTPPKDEQAMRYSVLYGFNNAKTIGIYEKYLTEVIIPKIPKGGTVIIHGYTDMIGDEDYNRNLSEERANDVLNILKRGLARIGRKDVEFKVYGFGEDSNLVPFENGTPEERFYNRTVIIDIIPKK